MSNNNHNNQNNTYTTNQQWYNKMGIRSNAKKHTDTRVMRGSNHSNKQ